MNTTEQAAVHIHMNPTVEAVKTTAVGGGAVASYLTLNEWVAMLTIIFIFLQIGLLIPKYWRMYRAFKENRRVEIDE